MKSNESCLAALVIAIGWLATAPNPSAAAEVPDQTVTPPPPPTDQELAGDSLSQFIAHHATVHYFSTGTMRNLARWRGGLQSICPVTVGLSPAYSSFVTARLRALAAYVGAPVQSNPQCETNVQMIFTNHPQEVMDEVTKWATDFFRIRYTGGGSRLIAFRGDHAIQGWYLTTRGGDIVLNTPVSLADLGLLAVPARGGGVVPNSSVSLVGLDLLPLWPQITENYLSIDRTGSRLRGSSGSGIGIGVVILVVDATKVSGDAIGTIADYLAMVTLSVVQVPDHCDPLPSILDWMSPSCARREMPTAITAGDLAFLKALYYRNTGFGPSLSRAAIEDNMLRQFKRR
jgi:hypothetical protein